jgi:hypothetical protein
MFKIVEISDILKILNIKCILITFEKLIIAKNEVYLFIIHKIKDSNF